MTSGGNLRLHSLLVFFDVWIFCVTYICTEDVEDSLFPSSLQVSYLNIISQLIVSRLNSS